MHHILFLRVCTSVGGKPCSCGAEWRCTFSGTGPEVPEEGGSKFNDSMPCVSAVAEAGEGGDVPETLRKSEAGLKKEAEVSTILSPSLNNSRIPGPTLVVCRFL